MTESDKIKIKKLIHTIGLNNNVVDDEVRLIIESQFRFTYEIIKNLNIKNLTEEEVLNLKTNFYYKYLGKLHTNKFIMNSYINKHKYKNKEEND